MKTITYRPFDLDMDAATLYDLTRGAYMELYGTFNLTLEEVLNDKRVPGFDCRTSSLAAFDDQGVMYGKAEVWALGDLPVKPVLRLYVLPDYRGLGIEEHLIAWALDYAKHVYDRVPDEARVTLKCGATRPEERRILESFGFVSQHQMLRMRIDFVGNNTPAPMFPEDFRVVTMAEHPVLRDYVRVYRDTFRDLRGFVDDDLEHHVARWQHDLDAYAENFDPQLFMLLKDGDTDAGVILTWKTARENENQAWVSVLGVMPDYRRRGLAQQLLYLAFQKFQALGKTSAALMVDGSSLTGANRLYEQVGMRPVVTIDEYELELRGGIEMSKQG